MLTRHEARATEYRDRAIAARKSAHDAVLAQVCEVQERAAARWDALADLEDAFIKTSVARRVALEEA